MRSVPDATGGPPPRAAAFRWIPLPVAVVGLGTVALAVNRGFDLSDEGYYWWASGHPNRLANSVTQFHHLTGALFEALGMNVALVRLAGLVLFVGCTWFLADAVRRWLSAAGIEIGPRAMPSLVALALIAPLGASIWLPQTPSYNDLMLIEVLLLGGATARAALSSDRRRALGWAIGAGVVIWAVAMTKFSGALAVGVLAVGMVTLAPNSEIDRQDRVRLLVAQGIGFVFGALIWQLAVNDLRATWRGMRIGLDDASSSHGTDSLLTIYRVDANALLLLAAITVAAVLLSRQVRASVAMAAWSVGAVWLVLRGPLATPGRPLAGLTLGAHLGPILLAAAMVGRGRAIVTASLPFPPRIRHRASLAALLGVVPLLSAAGTDNSLLVGAVIGAPFWTLAGFVVLAGRSRAAVAPVAVFATVAALMYGALGIRGTWIEPYHQRPLREATVGVEGIDALAGVRLDPDLARSISHIDTMVDEYSDGGHHWMLPFWRLLGLAHVTDSDISEFVWAPDAIDRNERAIDAACLDDDPVIVVTVGVLSPRYSAALSEACGESFPEAWDRLGTADLDVGTVDIYGLRGTG